MQNLATELTSVMKSLKNRFRNFENVKKHKIQNKNKHRVHPKKQRLTLTFSYTATNYKLMEISYKTKIPKNSDFSVFLK